MMSGAWPPPEPSVWNEWIARPSNASIVFSTKPDSLSVSVCMHTCTSISSATVSDERSTAGVVPQSSWHLKPTAPASTCSTSAALPCPWPLPRMPTLIGQFSKARSIMRMLPGPRRDGRRVGAVRRAGAAADERGGAVRQRSVRLLRRDEVDVRVDAGGGEDQVVARDRIGGQAAFEPGCDAVHHLRVARLADGADAAVLDADVGLHDAEDRVDDGHVGDHEVRRAAPARDAVVHAHAFAQALAAAEDDLVARRRRAGRARSRRTGRCRRAGCGRRRWGRTGRRILCVRWLPSEVLDVDPGFSASWRRRSGSRAWRPPRPPSLCAARRSCRPSGRRRGC